ncbi:MAG TPA: hypothetical protein VI603_12540 [Saprospiraceae bacterium]|nr:hypothetical protein [Saprospiraceae bacterium]
MLYNNREYPHPVLGIEDSVSGKFAIHVSVKASKQTIKIIPVFELNNSTLNRLIQEGNAVFGTHIYCRATMFRKLIRSEMPISKEIVIPAQELRNRVDLDFFICAVEDIPHYKNDLSHTDYNGYSFYIEKGEILAYGGKAEFNANKSPEELKSVSAFMNIDKYEKENGPVYNFYDGDKITIRLPENDYLMYQHIVNNPFIANILHSTIVLPALMEAIDVVLSGTDEYLNNSWFQILQKIVEETKEESLIGIAQKVLDNPINRAFKTVQTMIEYEE